MKTFKEFLTERGLTLIWTLVEGFGYDIDELLHEHQQEEDENHG